jgi:L-fuculose-phosphate aldolase
MNFQYLHPADQIVMIMERIYNSGMTTTSGGNLSVMDNEGVMWITPSGVDKGSLKREDIMRVYPDGHIEGRHKPSVEYPFHSSIYKKRPDLRAVLHAHPPALVALTLVRKNPEPYLLPNTSIDCGQVEMAPYALPGSAKLGDNISAVFEKGMNVAMMENHGVVLGAQSLFEAFTMFEALNYSAELQIKALQLGPYRTLTPEQMTIYKQKNVPHLKEYRADEPTSEELELRRELCGLIKRAYRNGLFSSSQGTFSTRVDGDNFIITPYGKDRMYLEPQDLVRIENGMVELDKKPSRATKFHMEIYKQHPEINSIIMAYPPNIMAFAVTDEEFDARLIPESYIALKTVRKFPFGASISDPVKLAAEMTLKNPVAIEENDMLIVVGTSPLNAFDRLEVAEYSAKSVISTKRMCDIVKISPDEIKEIEVAFNL